MTSLTSSTTPLQYDDIGDDSLAYRRHRRLIILIQIGEVGFLIPIGRLESLTLIIVRKDDTQILRSTG